MKNTLIELAKEAGFTDFKIDMNEYGVHVYGKDITGKLTKFAELLQANSGNAVDERAGIVDYKPLTKAIKQKLYDELLEKFDDKAKYNIANSLSHNWQITAIEFNHKEFTNWSTYRVEAITKG